MCWCDEYEMTINRADELMIRKTDKNEWIILDPETIINLASFALSLNRPAMIITTHSYSVKNGTLYTNIEMREK